MNRKPDYGIDAPTVIRNVLVAGIILVGAGLFLRTAPQPAIAQFHRITPSLLSTGLSCVLCGLIMLWGSRVGKLRLRDTLISNLTWKGSEQVLDVGCGHGLMLIAAAKRLTTGTATGVDIWQKVDQAGNTAAATQENIDREGVTDRTVLRNGDARNLPFPDHTFDLVLSSWALHNIYDRQERDKAISEIIRVLKPEGRAVITDIRHGSQYALAFRQGGMVNLRRSLPNFLFVIPTMTISAQKPKPRAT